MSEQPNTPISPRLALLALSRAYSELANELATISALCLFWSDDKRASDPMALLEPLAQAGLRHHSAAVAFSDVTDTLQWVHDMVLYVIAQSKPAPSSPSIPSVFEQFINSLNLDAPSTEEES